MTTGIYAMYVQLQAAVEKMADTFESMLIGPESTFASFSCNEIETVWEVLDRAGRRDTANAILAAHAEGDDEGDAHYTGPKPEPMRLLDRSAIPNLWREDHPGEHKLGIYGQSSADGWHCWGCGWQHSAVVTDEQAEALHEKHLKEGES
jgi:hypothetical protein